MVKYVPDDLEQIFKVLLSQNEACIERTSIVMLPEIFVVPCIIDLTTTGLETDHPRTYKACPGVCITHHTNRTRYVFVLFILFMK